MYKIQDFSFRTFWKKTIGPRYTPAQGWCRLSPTIEVIKIPYWLRHARIQARVKFIFKAIENQWTHESVELPKLCRKYQVNRRYLIVLLWLYSSRYTFEFTELLLTVEKVQTLQSILTHSNVQDKFDDTTHLSNDHTKYISAFSLQQKKNELKYISTRLRYVICLCHWIIAYHTFVRVLRNAKRCSPCYENFPSLFFPPTQKSIIARIFCTLL